MKQVIILTAAFFLSVSAIAGNGNSKKEDDKYCAKLRDGKITVMYEGSIITADVTLANGTEIKTDGTIIKKDGTKVMLKEGECINKEGSISEQPVKDEQKSNHAK